jgi:hypothetical protein
VIATAADPKPLVIKDQYIDRPRVVHRI